jgi:hypothetical protein
MRHFFLLFSKFVETNFISLKKFEGALIKTGGNTDRHADFVNKDPPRLMTRDLSEQCFSCLLKKEEKR